MSASALRDLDLRARLLGVAQRLPVDVGALARRKVHEENLRQHKGAWPADDVRCERGRRISIFFMRFRLVGLPQRVPQIALQ